MAHPYAKEAMHSHNEKMHRMMGRKSGGRAHSDEKEDRALFHKLIKEHDKKEQAHEHGAKAKSKPSRYARGGKVKGKTQINIMVHPGQAGQGAAQAPAPIPPAALPAMPPRPPMPPMAGPGMPPGLPPGLPPGIVPRKSGGRVKEGRAYREGIRNGTQVQHHPGKNDLMHLTNKPPITKARGGTVKMRYGSESGEGRLEKTKMQKRTYP